MAAGGDAQDLSIKIKSAFSFKALREARACPSGHGSSALVSQNDTTSCQGLMRKEPPLG